MSSCECSICFDDITASTGSTTLSCGHVFHFSCIAKWFVNSCGESASTCALCRKEMGETEDLAKDLFMDVGEDDDDDEDDSDYETESESGSNSEDHEEQIARRVAFLKSCLSMMSEENARQFAATKIQSVCRTYMASYLFRSVRGAKMWVERCEDRLRQSKVEMKIATEALRAGTRWKKQVATKLQAIWRGYRMRRLSLAMVVYHA